MFTVAQRDGVRDFVAAAARAASVAALLREGEDAGVGTPTVVAERLTAVDIGYRRG